LVQGVEVLSSKRSDLKEIARQRRLHIESTGQDAGGAQWGSAGNDSRGDYIPA
jgi:hypothetical protein